MTFQEVKEIQERIIREQNIKPVAALKKAYQERRTLKMNPDRKLPFKR